MSWYPSTPPIHETVPFHFAQHLNSPALSHIVLNSLLMESLWPVIEALQAVRLSRQYEEQRVVALKDAWTVFEERAAAWSTEVESAPRKSSCLAYLVIPFSCAYVLTCISRVNPISTSQLQHSHRKHVSSP